MKQCEIWDIDLDPTEGSKQRGKRPAVIISGNAMNDHFKLVIVCPITSRVKNYMGNLVISPTGENGLITESEILVFQIRSVSKSRLKRYRGKITSDQLNQLKMNLGEVLTF